jgi:AAA+ ATPase superfamily predicted ATPase
MNQQVPFIGRQEELSRLQECRENRIADLVVITGRRRIGNYVHFSVMEKF